MQIVQTRRRFVAGLAAGAAGLVAAPRLALAEPPPETTSVRLPRWINGAYCWAGSYLAGELLRADGFADVQYVQGDPKLDQSVWIARGETDFSVNYAPVHIASIDSGVPIKVLTGLHSGCLELVAKDSIMSIAELRGKRVGARSMDSPSYVFVALMAAYVGLDPIKDIEWVIADVDPMPAFIEGKFDAFLFFPPFTQVLRAKKIGHTILNTTLDQPWSQHFCCMISARSEYVAKYPAATKRVLRAILKSADVCRSNPEWSAAQLVERGFLPDYGIALQTLSDTRYDVWREYDPEATLRFFALRMLETGMIKASPQEILASGTDWRFLNELKREMKT